MSYTDGVVSTPLLQSAAAATLKSSNPRRRHATLSSITLMRAPSKWSAPIVAGRHKETGVTHYGHVTGDPLTAASAVFLACEPVTPN